MQIVGSADIKIQIKPKSEEVVPKTEPVVVYRGLNNQIHNTSWSRPRISDVIDSLDGNMFFSNIGLFLVIFK